MKKEIINASEFGLEQKQVGDVDMAFSEKVKERELLSKVYAKVIGKDITKEVAKEARDIRLKAVKIKTGIANIHQVQKSFALAFGKYCDAWKRKETEPVQQIIDGLTEIEKHEEIKEQERLDALQQERVLLLSKYIEVASERDLSYMCQDVWDSYLEAKKKQHTENLADELKAEKERVEKIKAEKDEQERIKKENEKLRLESEKREKELKIAEQKRADIDRVRKEKDDADRKSREVAAQEEREAYESEIKSEREAKEKVEKEEREKREKLQAELDLKIEHERKAKELEQANIQLELNKGDEDKVKDLISDLNSLKSKYTFKSAKNTKMYRDVGMLIDKISEHIKHE